MSENVFQVSVRGRIPELDGKTDEEVLGIFCEKFGKPKYEGEVYWDSNEHSVVPIYDYENKRWGLQRVFVRDSDSEAAAHISIDDFLAAEILMKRLFPSIESVFVSAYVYYNGADEPIIL
jgi:hypothetical protein